MGISPVEPIAQIELTFAATKGAMSFSKASKSIFSSLNGVNGKADNPVNINTPWVIALIRLDRKRWVVFLGNKLDVSHGAKALYDSTFCRS